MILLMLLLLLMLLSPLSALRQGRGRPVRVIVIHHTRVIIIVNHLVIVIESRQWRVLPFSRAFYGVPINTSLMDHYSTQQRFERHLSVHKFFLNLWAEQNQSKQSFLLLTKSNRLLSCKNLMIVAQILVVHSCSKKHKTCLRVTSGPISPQKKIAKQNILNFFTREIS